MSQCLDRPRRGLPARKSRTPYDFQTYGTILKCIPEEIINKSNDVYQKVNWKILEKSISVLIGKVNVNCNIRKVYEKLLNLNILRGKGLFCQHIMEAQMNSIQNTQYYSTLVSFINLELPKIGELLVERCILQLKLPCSYQEKVSSLVFISHLVNHRVADTSLAVDLINLLLKSPSENSILLAYTVLYICAYKIKEISENGIHNILDTMHNTLTNQKPLDDDIRYMMEVLWQIIKKVGFVERHIDLMKDKPQNTHVFSLNLVIDPHHHLDYFHYDPEYDHEADENIYKLFCAQILNKQNTQVFAVFMYDSDMDDEINTPGVTKRTIVHQNIISLRDTLNAILDISLNYQEIAHRLMEIKLRPGLEMELCRLFLNYFCEYNGYTANLGYTAQIFCQLNKLFVVALEKSFMDSYKSIHYFSIKKSQNVAKFFAYLLITNTIPWKVLSIIQLDEFKTTSFSRRFTKALLLEILGQMGYAKLNARVIQDPTLKDALKNILYGDHKKIPSFSVNFFTSIGLDGLITTMKYLK